MGRLLTLIYGIVAYAAFLIVFLYLIGFVGNLAVVPKGIDSRATGPMGMAVLVNVLLLLMFAIQHTIMARPSFKEWWTKIIPQPAERSTFVLATSLVLAFMCAQWRPMTANVWQVENVAMQTLLWSLFAAGWIIALYSSFLIDHFDLFGVRQVVLHWQGREYTPRPFAQRSLYRLVRHPLMSGFMIAVWATPTMSQGHLLFAVVISCYIFIGIAFEERDLVRNLGEDYRRYRRETPMLFPIPKRRHRPTVPT